MLRSSGGIDSAHRFCKPRGIPINATSRIKARKKAECNLFYMP
nr:MAG TPA: hypothetical protein [Herelleviridae sp.]